jgi:O-acetylhomoserine (thiol)-lyase
MNPTTDVFEKRIAALEKGAAALAVSSGAAAITYAIQNIAGDGDHIIADKQISIATADLFVHTLADFGINTTFVDGNDPRNFEAAITQETKAIFIETLGVGATGTCFTVDIERIANIAHQHGIPLIADNTLATPYLLTPADYGADIVIHSAATFIGGRWAGGGVIVDIGRFDWDKNKKFPRLSEPNDSYHGVVFTDVVGRLAYITKARTTLLRDTGAALGPLDAFLLLQGLETLSLRMERHLQNTHKVVDFLKTHPRLERVHHLSLPEHRDHALYQKYFPKGALSFVTFELKGNAADTQRFIDALELSENCAVIEIGKKRMIQLAVGTEYAGDIIADLERGFGANSLF